MTSPKPVDGLQRRTAAGHSLQPFSARSILDRDASLLLARVFPTLSPALHKPIFGVGVVAVGDDLDDNAGRSQGQPHE